MKIFALVLIGLFAFSCSDTPLKETETTNQTLKTLTEGPPIGPPPEPIPNQPPEVTIVLPVEDDVYLYGDTVVFQGTALDWEEGILTSGLQWTSEIVDESGTIFYGSGHTFFYETGPFGPKLSARSYTVQVWVIDSTGAMGSSFVTFSVQDTT